MSTMKKEGQPVAGPRQNLTGLKTNMIVQCHCMLLMVTDYTNKISVAWEINFSEEHV